MRDTESPPGYICDPDDVWASIRESSTKMRAPEPDRFERFTRWVLRDLRRALAVALGLVALGAVVALLLSYTVPAPDLGAREPEDPFVAALAAAIEDPDVELALVEILEEIEKSIEGIE